MIGCYHCGQAVLRSGFDSVVDAETRAFCCAGCLAVSEMIHSAGMGRYYELRDAPEGFVPGDMTQQFVEFDENFDTYAEILDGIASTTLYVEGMYCTACSWLVEATLSASSAVESVSIDPLSHRVYVEWHVEDLRLGGLLGLLAAVGYAPRPMSRHTGERPEYNEERTALKRLLVASLGMMQVMMFAIALYAGDAQGIDERMAHFLRLVSMVVATPVVFYAARPFFDGAIRGLLALRPGMDLPVAIAIGLAFAGSVYSTFTRGNDVWFDSVVMFVFFLTLGRFIEMRARQRAVTVADALKPLIPDTAVVLEGDSQSTRAVATLKIGDRLLLRPGDYVPADAVVEAGDTNVDESVLSGESKPQKRSPGDAIIAGSINLDTAIEARVSATGSATILGGIQRLSRTALHYRPSIVQTADRIASYFVFAILLLATAVATAWSFIDPGRAFVVTLSVLVVTCPCALALATPAAFAAVNSKMATLKLLLKNSNSIEALARCTHVVFDKTGTLTLGRPAISSVLPLRAELSKAQALEIAAALEASSSHPIANAFRGTRTPLRAHNVSVLPGKGIFGLIDGRSWTLGRGVDDHETDPQKVQDASQKAIRIVLSDDQGPAAEFTLEDAIRADAAETVANLKAMGLQISLLSGDAPEAVQDVAVSLGIDEWRARLSPADKLDAIQSLQRSGARVLMVGDGINDAPVIAGADMSIAPAAAAEVTQTRADIVFLGDGLSPVASALLASRRTLRVVRQNLTWAITYNIAAVPLAAAGMVPTWLAAIGMSASSLVVVFNALRLSR